LNSYNWVYVFTIILSLFGETTLNDMSYDCIPLQQNVGEDDKDRRCDPFDKQRPFYTKSTSEAYLNSFPELSINLTYWVVNRLDGTSDNPIDSLKIKESVQVLNDSYKSLNIKFKLKSVHPINDSLLYWTRFSKFSSLARQSDYIDTTSINVYVPFRFTNFKNNLRGAQVSSRGIAINSYEYNTGIIVHEIGHVFDLKHTHRGFKGNTCERVTRDTNNADYNADCSGDFVTDTGAMRELNNNKTYISQDCNYMGTLTDCDGTPYQIGDAEVKNFMSYTLQHCRDRFTTGQMVRVREYLKNDPLGVVKTFAQE